MVKYFYISGRERDNWCQITIKIGIPIYAFELEQKLRKLQFNGAIRVSNYKMIFYI